MPAWSSIGLLQQDQRLYCKQLCHEDESMILILTLAKHCTTLAGWVWDHKASLAFLPSGPIMVKYILELFTTQSGDFAEQGLMLPQGVFKW